MQTSRVLHVTRTSRCNTTYSRVNDSIKSRNRGLHLGSHSKDNHFSRQAMADDDNLKVNSVGSVVANEETGKRLKRRVLCQARGLSQDHNASTAFIDIPVGAPHGLLLVCSHVECANSHRRFRYCRGTLLHRE
jgi:hypothetical protein